MKRSLGFIFILFMCLPISGCDFSFIGAEQGKNRQVNNYKSPPKKNYYKTDFNFLDESQYENDDEKLVELSSAALGRKDPFKPFNQSLLSEINSGSSNGLEELELPSDADPFIMDLTKYDKSLLGVPLPPEYDEDSPLVKLMKIKIAGILYDPEGSSAILNVDGEDYVVHENDKIFNFHVNQILPDKVAISYGKNIYKKRVGEMLTATLNGSGITGINNMFAGKRKNINLNSKTDSLPDIRFVAPSAYF